MKKTEVFTCSIFFLLGMMACNQGQKSQVSESAGLSVFILSESELPDYEKEIDHQGLIEAWGDRHGESLRTGEHIYNNICFNCHGNTDQEGSLPTAFKFWKDTFKVGNDPFSIYQTLTRGYGSMPPQTNLTPVEKYDIIHFIRETFLLENNPGQYFDIDSTYLASLPAGRNMGPAPKEFKPWAEMDYGNFLVNTYELVGLNAPPRERSSGPSPLPDENYVNANFAYKGIAVRLDKGKGGIAAGKSWMMFDHDLMRVAGAWTGEGFIDWEAILFNGRHNISPRTVGDLHFENRVGPGWANPNTGTFDDPRFMARDKRKFGPLPREWAHFKGMYQFADRLILSYTVGNSSVLETFGLESLDQFPVFTRTLNISPSDRKLKMRVAPKGTAVSLIGNGALLKEEGDFILMEVQPSVPAKIKLLIGKAGMKGLEAYAKQSSAPESLKAFTKGGPARYPQKLKSTIAMVESDGPFQVDVMNPPFDSPWKNQFRLSGIDFFKNPNQGVVCTTDGDVWFVEGFTAKSGELTWQRIASGLFQPLGIKVVNGEIFVTCRDQLVRLHDFNGDRETDFYESFNNDHQVTDHFHEFAMGLQTDKEGNFYYAKSARHAREALVPQHGTLIKVSKDGRNSEIIAHGFRAANGVCLNPDGTFIVTDQEGHWNPMNRINWVKKGGFYGNMFGYNPPADSTDLGMEQPLVWVERDRDQSPSELLWVESKKWGALNGKLLNLSYGYGKVFVVPFEKIGDQVQGGIYELPIPRFSTGIMRGRFNPGDGQLYVCGLSAWGSTQPQLGGLYRIRATGKPMHVPIGIQVMKDGLELTFSESLDINSAKELNNYSVKTWDLLRSRKYGSSHYNVQTLEVSKADISKDGKTLKLKIPNIQPTWVMEIQFNLKSEKGESVEGLIQNTIHRLGESSIL
ncbi:cbb3-type cytochrome c oxidase subunit III [Cecembia calidifontis]|uniref:Cbb3-type cytochrome c oxidase subunit III n=2 Tax=Cecembia calidifontis TaxID=1187080 RepID=A0A4Q7P8P6_9BACT|nr:cbb3-type cytochrome c oxidase subunit III [Cecembia calidifontis]